MPKRETDRGIKFYCSEDEAIELYRLAKEQKQSVVNYIKIAINMVENRKVFEIRESGARLGGLAKARIQRKKKADKIKPSLSPWEVPGYFDRKRNDQTK